MQQEQNPQKSKSKSWAIIVGIIFAVVCLCVIGISAFTIYASSQQNQYVGKPTPIPEQIYVDLRTAALNTKASELGLQVDVNSNQPYGIIMDWNLGSATVTLVSFKTGDASLYYSTGGGWLGGYSVEKINSTSIEFVNSAGEYVTKLNKVSEYPMPPVNYVRFYIITSQGVYGSDDIDDDTLTKNGTDFTPLFGAAQNVISEIRVEMQK